MSFKCGLVGLPNVGKSTLFNQLTRLKIPAENFPFCTIKPNTGIVPIFDDRLDEIAKVVLSNNIIPIFIELIDIAGLVKGAHKGEGLGNQFLDYIRDVDVIMHVVRCFQNRNITHIYGKVEPIQDIEVVNIELILSDIELCNNRLYKLNKKYLSSTDNLKVKKEILILQLCIRHLEKNRDLRSLNLTQEDFHVIKYLRLITLKPVVYILNMSKHAFKNVHEQEVCNFVKEQYNLKAIRIFLDSTPYNLYDNYISKKQKDFLFKKWFNNNLRDFVLSGFSALNLVTFFTAGKKEVHAWTASKNSFIFQSVKCIHSDLSRGFIRAQVISYDDFIKYGGEKKSKELGKVRIEGKKYVINDGDIIHVLYKV